MYYAGNRKRITSFKTNNFENSSECIKYERAHPGCIIALALSKKVGILFVGQLITNKYCGLKEMI